MKTKKGLKNNRLLSIAVMMGLVAVLFAPLGNGLAGNLPPARSDSLPAQAKPASLSMQAEARGDAAARQASKECPCASNKSTDSNTPFSASTEWKTRFEGTVQVAESEYGALHWVVGGLTHTGGLERGLVKKCVNIRQWRAPLPA